MDIYDVDTEEILKKSDSPEQFRQCFIESSDEPYLQDYLKVLIDREHVTPKDLMQKSLVSKTYFYQFLRGDRFPGRNTALRIAFSLSLSLKETNRLLKLSEKPILYPKVRRDAAIIYCIKKGMDLDESNEYLISISEEALI